MLTTAPPGEDSEDQHTVVKSTFPNDRSPRSVRRSQMTSYCRVDSRTCCQRDRQRRGARRAEVADAMQTYACGPTCSSISTPRRPPALKVRSDIERAFCAVDAVLQSRRRLRHNEIILPTLSFAINLKNNRSKAYHVKAYTVRLATTTTACMACIA